MVGILPVPHAIIIRKFESLDGEGGAHWLTCYVWGVVFLRVRWPVWDGDTVELFRINIDGEQGEAED